MRVVLVTLVFVIAALIGGLSHLTWLMVSNSPALAGGLLAALAVMGLYLVRVSRRFRRAARRRPLDQLFEDFQGRSESVRDHQGPAAAPERTSETAVGAADDDGVSAGAETPGPAPEAPERP